MDDDLKLAIKRTELSNQRTFLAFLRTGLTITIISSSFGKIWYSALGIFLIIGSFIQYIVLKNELNPKNKDKYKTLLLPIIFVFFTFIAIYLEFIKR